ncbi:MAG: hypothetical protein KKI09_03080 [Spirochaetes bacterium]|nr:hypothetical protein [Spirochaetota bacterium]MBU0954389.1 hypothetical protein [Spirochaetota bacterium]
MFLRKTSACLILLGLLLSAVHAQPRVTIQFHDKTLYSTSSDIMVRVSIFNDSTEVYRFRLADERRLSLNLEARTLSNRQLPASNTWLRTMAANTPAYYRELSLLPGEEYSFIENVHDYVAINEAGTYLLHCVFSPELVGRPQQEGLRSNVLTLSVRPGSPTPSAAEQFIAGTTEILRAQRIPPDEVIRRTITARQKSHWNEFFLYLDLEAMLRNSAERRRVYDRESDDGRRRMLSEFKTELMQGVVDTDIVVVPSSFEIVETRYGMLYGTVDVLQKFAYDGFFMVKQYIYELEKRDDIWNIVAYTVINKGSE